jgi:murein DD-endopeptidase MepM/ murein hydrolase activator NlpD
MADPFGNPFQTASRAPDRTPTGSIGAAPTTAVQSRPLAPPRSMSSGPVASYTAPAYQKNQRMASSASYANTGRRSRGGVAGWTAEGGMPVVVAQGESAGLVARRYGIPEDALLRTNGFMSAAQVRPGTRLVIPIYNASLAESSGVHVNAHRQFAERVPVHHDRLKFVKGPDAAVVRAKRREEKIARVESEKKAEAREKRHVEKIAKVEHTQVFKPEAKAHGARIEKVALTETGSSRVQKKSAIDPMPTASTRVESGKSAVEAAIPEFRWPARGRVIEGFKIGANDGINIALPEGTSVKAADAGVVAYAGNGLKGYGNLILLRHSNGFVTAYANNGEIDVKRGETVRRGQVIAKSGQTGNVSTPQLHFEVRKGARPVNPIQYLAAL